MWFRRHALSLTVLALVAVGCAGPTPPPEAEDSPFRRSVVVGVFATAYSQISDRYLDPIAPAALAVKGLGHLDALDSSLAIERHGAEVELRHRGAVHKRFPTPGDADVDGWAALSYDAIMLGRAIAPDGLGKTSADQMYKTMFDGILSGFDPHSRYAGPEETARARARREGYGGIGIAFNLENGRARIASITKDGPAEKSGIKAGDEIIAIDGVPVAGQTSTQISDRLRGPPLSNVTLAISRPPNGQLMALTIPRVRIVPPTLFASRDDDLLILRVTNFNQLTSASVARKLRETIGAPGVRTRGVILDLRGNPGGLLQQAVDLADLFLVRGRIASTQGRHPDSRHYHDARGDDLAQGLPLAVLIDGKSASAAEVVTAALQDQGRAVVVGTASFGKGTVQTVIRLPNRGEMTVTWSRMTAPSGYAFHGLGILPNLCTAETSLSGRELAQKAAERAADLTAQFADWRAAPFGDEPTRQRLRQLCPPAARGGPLETEAAKAILRDRDLYIRLLKLAAAPLKAER